MIPIVSFIGWQDSGKTTIALQVVEILKQKGYRVAVVKSTHHSEVQFDREGSDTDRYRKSGADAATLLAPDQMVTISNRPDAKLTDIVHRSFHDVDIVIAEGFKDERHIDKIEVTRGEGKLLSEEVNGVIAFVTERQLPGETVFRPDQAGEIADFIIARSITSPEIPQTEAILYVNGKKVPMKGFVQEALAGTVLGFIGSLKKTEDPQTLEIRIRYTNKASD